MLKKVHCLENENYQKTNNITTICIFLHFFEYLAIFLNQDQLCWMDGNLAFTVGADYNGNGNFLVRINDKGDIAKIYRLNESYAVEGCYYDGSTLYILNYGLSHKAKKYYNYLAQYEVKNETIDKKNSHFYKQVPFAIPFI